MNLGHGLMFIIPSTEFCIKVFYCCTVFNVENTVFVLVWTDFPKTLQNNYNNLLRQRCDTVMKEMKSIHAVHNVYLAL